MITRAQVEALQLAQFDTADPDAFPQLLAEYANDLIEAATIAIEDEELVRESESVPHG